jgi:hypothetical protein
VSLSHPLLPFPERIGAFFIMYPYNCTVVRRSWYLSQLPDNKRDPFADPSANSSSGEKEEPEHGDELVYEEGMEVGSSKLLAGVASFALFGFFALFKFSGLVRSSL